MSYDTGISFFICILRKVMIGQVYTQCLSISVFCEWWGRYYENFSTCETESVSEHGFHGLYHNHFRFYKLQIYSCKNKLYFLFYFKIFLLNILFVWKPQTPQESLQFSLEALRQSVFLCVGSIFTDSFQCVWFRFFSPDLNTFKK